MDDALTHANPAAVTATARAAEQWIQTQYEELAPGLYRYLVRLVGEAPAAQDILQETFLRLFEAVRGRRAVRRPRPWAFQVAHNLAVDFLRQRGREEWTAAELSDSEQAGGEPGVEAELLRNERSERVRRALCLLSSQERQVLELRAEGLRYREIAALMNLQVSTVATFLSRAIQKIARQLHG